MLVLKREVDESKVVVTVPGIDGSRVSLGFAAARLVPICRGGAARGAHDEGRLWGGKLDAGN